LAAIGLLDLRDVDGGAVVRMPKAYPVYDASYRDALDEIRAYLGSIPNLHLVGRNGQHRYNNQDHSMLTGIFAARNVAGASYDLWRVNAEAEYHEEAPAADRETPGPLAGEELDALLRSAFARIDPVALGGAAGVVAAAALALLSAWLAWRGGEAGGPTLSLLGQYLFGYRPRWPPALFGVADAPANSAPTTASTLTRRGTAPGTPARLPARLLGELAGGVPGIRLRRPAGRYRGRRGRPALQPPGAAPSRRRSWALALRSATVLR
jgi:hypothetical protein